MKYVPARFRVEAWIIVAATSLCLGCGERTPALKDVLATYPQLGDGIYESLGTWKAVLGEPSTVSQADGGHTFFYWPEHGLAVFTHPLYQGQYRAKRQNDRKVTSVLIPLQKSWHPGFLPVEEGTIVTFERLLPFRAPPERRASSDVGEVPAPSYSDVVSSPLRKTVERVHYQGRTPVAVEIRDEWWLSHYD